MYVFWALFGLDHWIYYYGGLKASFQPTSEVLAFDTIRYQWKVLDYVVEKNIHDIERSSHAAIQIENRYNFYYNWLGVIFISILVFGGSAFNKPETQDKSNPLLMASKEKKVSLEDVLIFETSIKNNYYENL